MKRVSLKDAVVLQSRVPVYSLSSSPIYFVSFKIYLRIMYSLMKYDVTHFFGCRKLFVLIVWMVFGTMPTLNAALAEVSGSIDFVRPKLQWTQLDHSTLRMMVKKDGYKRTLPTAAVMQAIARGHSSFMSVSRKLPESDEKDLPKDYKALAADTYHEVHHTADFKNDVNIFSLDESNHASSIKDIDEDYLLHCPAESHLHAQVGDIFAASEHGASVHSREGVKNNLDVYMKSPDIAKHEGFKVLRRVVAKSAAVTKREGNCVNYETEDIHPFELFDHLDIHGNVSRRFSRQYADRPQIKKESRLGTIGNSGLLDCSDPYWLSDALIVNQNGLLVRAGYTEACVDYTNNLGRIDMNYDYTNKKATVQDIEIIKGVVCHNCYAYIGGQLRFNVQYSAYTRSIGFYAGLSGGAGFNVNLKVNNPSISGSTTVVLANPAAEFSFIANIGGVSLSDKFGGLKLTLSGSGSATGSAEFTAGAGISASVWAYYSAAKGAKLETSVDFTPPFATFTYTAFKIKSVLVTAQLNGIINIKLSYGTIAENNAMTFQPYLQYAYNAQPASLAYREIDDTGKSVKTHAPIVVKPGGLVKYSVDYKTYTGNQELVAYYAISDGFNSYPIMQQNVTTLSTGHVTLSLEWTLPWDTRFLSDNETVWKVRIHVTNMLLGDDIVSRDDFLFDASSPFLEWPSNGAVVSTNASYEISWETSLLSYYYVMDSFFGAGELRETKNVSIYMYPSGCSGAFCMNQRIPLATSVENNAKYQLQFPSGVLENDVSYYLTVESMECGTCKGWSEGVFQVTTGSKNSAVAPVINSIVKNKRVTQLTTTSESNNPTSIRENQLSQGHIAGKRVALALNRKLGTCSGATSVTSTYGMKSGGSATISAFGASTPSLTMAPVDLVTAVESCQTDPNLLVPTNAPTLVPTVSKAPFVSGGGGGTASEGLSDAAVGGIVVGVVIVVCIIGIAVGFLVARSCRNQGRVPRQARVAAINESPST